jgi:hypothetical protein
MRRSVRSSAPFAGRYRDEARISRAAGTENLSPEKIDECIEAHLRLGSSIRASEETGVPARTIRELRYSQPERFAAIRHELMRMREVAVTAMVSRFTDTLGGSLATMIKGMAGNASDAQVRAAKAVVDSLAVLDKVSRLDAGTATDVVKTLGTPEACDDEKAKAEAEKAQLDAQIAAWFAEHPEMVPRREEA